MSEALFPSSYANPVEGCVVEFLDNHGIDCAAYTCGKCNVLASRGNDGLIYTAEDECENLLFDSVDRNYQIAEE
jgi:hypothetical protein